MSNQWTNATEEYRAIHREAAGLSRWMKENRTLVNFLQKNPALMEAIQERAIMEEAQSPKLTVIMGGHHE